MFEATSDLDGASNGADRSPGLSRRQLVKAGAWAAPVVVLATAVPAAATSLGRVTVVAGSAIAESVDGGSGKWLLTVKFNSTFTSPKTLSRTTYTFTLNGVTTTGKFVSGNNGNPTILLPASAAAASRPLGIVDSVVSGTLVTITYSVPTGVGPNTQPVVVEVKIP